MELNKENIKKIIFILFLTVAFCIALIHISSIWAALGSVLRVLTPIIIGFCLAFLLDPLTTILETKVFGFLERRFPKKGPAVARALGLAFCLIIVAGAIALLLLLVVPEVREAISIIGQTVPTAVTNAAVSINGWLERFDIEFQIPVGGSSEWMVNFTKIRQYVETLLNEGYLSNLANTALSVVSGFTSFILGLILSIYILAQRDKILLFFRQLTRAAFRPHTTRAVFKVTGLCNSAFRSFVTGQLTEAVIIALLCFFGMLVFRFPYPTATSAVIGVTALIPVFGAWIGGILGALLALSDSVTKALLFIVFLVVLQQLEGDLIYPRVVGKSVGLPGVLVFVAVTLGASISGVVGMLLAVPLCSVIYTLVKEFIDSRLSKKIGTGDDQKNAAAPPDTPPPDCGDTN